MFKIRKTAALAALFCSSVLNAWASADHMVIAMPQIPTIIEPQGINNNALDRYVGNVFETLLKADQKTGELKPGLAESWCRLSPDTVEFKLRSGVRFHDGTPLTADDVVFTFGPERFSGEKAPGRAVAWEFLGNLKEVVKVDDLTVRVTMKAPDPMIERRFSARTSEIISEDGWKAAGGWEKWLKAPVGTGPYRIASFKTGNRLELTRFDGYWGKTAPAAKVSFVEVPELSARVAGLRSGEFDLITEVPPDQVKPLSADGRIDVTGGAIDNIYGLVFDCKSSAVMQSKELRQAILHAIDRDILVNALFGGRKTLRSRQGQGSRQGLGLQGRAHRLAHPGGLLHAGARRHAGRRLHAQGRRPQREDRGQGKLDPGRGAGPRPHDQQRELLRLLSRSRRPALAPPQALELLGAERLRRRLGRV